jgi:hypothetical protein
MCAMVGYTSAAGGGQKATESGGEDNVQGSPRMWEPQVPVSTVERDVGKRLDDAETFQGPTPP